MQACCKYPERNAPIVAPHRMAAPEACGFRPRSENLETTLGKKFERWLAEGALAQMKGPAEAGPHCSISDCGLPALLPVLFRRHRVFEEILVLRREAFRELENLKAVAIADGPELDVG